VKDSGAPSIGDLVIALYDELRDISCVGLVMETKGIECKVLWSSESNPVGWWQRSKLKVISSSS
jgi:hypothetical protein